MKHKNYLFTLFFVLPLAAWSQCPGPSVRTALINLQRAGETVSALTTNGLRAGQVPVTDTCGNQRYTYFVRVLDTCVNYNPLVTIGNLPLSAFVYQCGTQDSLFYIDYKADAVLISVGGGTSVNWYNTNDTTTNLLRTATVLRSAWWKGIDSIGFLRWDIRPDGFIGSQFTLYQDSVVMDADTVVWASSWHPELQVHDLQADGTYFYADSLKVVGIGQFPGFPSLNFDGTEKGFFYDPASNGIMVITGNGTTFGYSESYYTPGEVGTYVDDGTGNNITQGYYSTSTISSSIYNSSSNENSEYNGVENTLISSLNTSLFGVRLLSKDTNLTSSIYVGHSTVSSGQYYNGRRAFGVRTWTDIDTAFDWIQTYLPNDTTENAVSFYNRAYYWKNEHPTGASPTDTLLHFWAATGPGNEAGQDPGFMTLDAIRAGATNWYNSNGTTTDNTRIATVTETATWLSDDVTVDGVYPFRFELAGESANEPEMMVWKFPAPNDDSLTLSQSDQELVFHSTNSLVMQADEVLSLGADSIQMALSGGSTSWKLARYGVISAPDGQQFSEYRTITGTSQTELFLDGSSAVWVIPTNSVQNFEVQVSAICSSVGNGVGINLGDSWSSWHVGGIKRITNTTSLIGSVQTPATAQADAGMSDAVVTIDADDTDESLRIRFTPPSTAGTTTIIKVIASFQAIQTSY